MHELALMESLVATVEREVAGRVMAVRLEVGALSAVVPDALRFCFDLCVEGTRLQGAELEILEVPGRGRCRRCAEELAIDGPLWPTCRCGSPDVEIVAGRELGVREVEVV